MHTSICSLFIETVTDHYYSKHAVNENKHFLTKIKTKTYWNLLAGEDAGEMHVKEKKTIGPLKK